MIDQISEVVTKIFEVIDRFKQDEVAKDRDIENYLRIIERCLRASVESLTEGIAPEQQLAELRVHARSLLRVVSDVMSEDEANELSAQLDGIVENPPESIEDIQPIETAIGIFKAHADTLTLLKVGKQKTTFIGRRTLIYGSLGMAAAVGAGWFGGKRTPSVKWRMISVFGDDAKNIILYKAPQMICDRVGQMTNGKFIIEIIDNKAIKTEQILEKVSGEAEDIACSYSGIFYESDRYKALFFGCAIPFGLSPQNQTAWLSYKKNPDEEFTFVQGIYGKLGLNVVPFPAGGTGRQMGGWFQKEVNSIDDLNGLTMRIPGLGAEVLSKYFNVTLDRDLPGGAIPIGKIAEALKDGTLDAAEWTGPHDDYQLGLNKEAKYYYYPGWQETSTTLDIQVNLNRWIKLPPEYKEIFKAACQQTYIDIVSEYDRKNSEKFQEIENTGIIRSFNTDIIQLAREKTESLLELYASKNSVFAEVHDEWKRFRARSQAWSNLSST